MKMSRRHLITGFAAVLVLSSCGTTGGSAEELAERVRGDIHADFNQLKSPKEAKDRSILVVKGTVVEITEGVRVVSDDSEINSRMSGLYSTFVVEVSEVVDGDPGRLTDGKAYVNVLSDSGPSRLSRVNPDAQAVAVLYELPDTPVPGARYQLPRSTPSGAALLGSFADGLWLQGPADTSMIGIHTDRESLADTWSNPKTIDDYAQRIKTAP